MTNRKATTVERLDSLSEEQAKLVALLMKRRARQPPRIEASARGGSEARWRLPMSAAQLRLWLIDRLQGAGLAYHIPLAIRIEGELDRTALRAALDVLVHRHETLRTVFVEVGGEPMQEIVRDARFVLGDFDLSDLDAAARETEVRRHEHEEAHAPFDLGVGPLIRGRLLRVAAAEHVLVLVVHHIVFDGWSLGVLTRELAALYGAFKDRKASPLQPLAIQYADYAQWQRQWLEGEVQKKQLDYWRHRLDGAAVQLELPADRPRPMAQSYRGETIEVTFNSALTAGLNVFAQRHGVTLFMLLYAAWSLLLARLSGQRDILIGTPVANRQRPEVEGLIGFFVNTVVLRMELSGDLRVAQLLRQAKDVTLGAFDNQDVPFEQVVEMLQPQRTLNRNPIFQVMLVVHNAHKGELNLPGLTVRPEPGVNEPSKFDLLMQIEERGEQIVGGLNYATDLFDRSTVERWLGCFLVLLRTMMKDDHGNIDELPLLPEKERRRIVQDFNPTRAAYPQEKLVHELFEEQVRHTPSAVAVEHNGSVLTYAELNGRANQLARHLRERGVASNRVVGICVERSPEMVVGLLGILKAGAAYLPLDPNYPPDRLQYMLEDANPSTVLTQRKLRARLPLMRAETVLVDEGHEWQAEQATTDLPAAYPHPQQTVYVIYTSGSTGRPKGTAMAHRSMVNLVHWHRTALRAGAGERVLQFAALSFDVAFQEVFTTLCTGGTLVFLDELVRKDPQALLQLLGQQTVHRLFLPPLVLQSVAESFQAEKNPRLHLHDVITAGEQLRISPEIVHFFEAIGDCSLHNHYGPTESHVVTALTLAGAPAAWPVWPSIGKPIANSRIYILDAHRQPVPIGTSGEIYIAGAGVALGYLGRPELTAVRFVPDTFGSESGGTMYRTGDLARWRADGSIEYLRRTDHQIKIRGFRVELGEIESHLMQHPQVKEGVVVAREDVPGQKLLVAYVTRRDEDSLTLDELRMHMKSALPDFMIPSAFVILDRFPLSPNGKLERGALPAPTSNAYLSREYAAAQGEVEQILAGIWQDLLRVDRVGRHDNFFELGGHSLLMVQMLARLRRVGLSAEVRYIYMSQTLADLAATLTRQLGEVVVPPNLIPAGCTRITPLMLPLIELSQGQVDIVSAAVPGGAANVQDIYPLVALQEGILFHHVMSGMGGDAYVRPMLFSLSSSERLDAFINALQVLVDRHDVLRTAVLWEQLPRPVQVVYRRATVSVQELMSDTQDALERLRELMNPACQRVELQQAPLLRLFVVRGAPGSKSYALLQTHHIICDNESLHSMIAEIRGLLEGGKQAPESSLPYRNHVVEALHHARTHDAEAFFRKKLADVDQPTAPFGIVDVQSDGSQLKTACVEIDSEAAERIRRQARCVNVTVAAFFHAVWALAVARTSGRDDVVFGTVLLGRFHGSVGAQRTLGMFINTLPLRVQLKGAHAEELVQRTQRELVQLLGHEQASLSVAQRCSAVAGNAPLFSTLLNYVYGAVDLQSELASSGIEVLATQGGTNYPVSVLVNDRGDAGFTLEMKTDRRMDPLRVTAYMQTALQSLLSALEQSSTQPVISFHVLPERERREVLETFNAAPTEYPRDQLLHQKFSEQARRIPDLPAVEYEGQRLTFAELDAKTTALGNYLQSRGIGADDLVGLCVERGIEMAIGMLGILKAGAAYVPLDPGYPAERLEYMIQDAKPKMLLTQNRLLDQMPVVTCQIVALDAEWHDISATAPISAGSLKTPVSSSHLAYVIYTSGSTGRPKGVMIEHRNVLSLWQGLEHLYRQSPCRRVAVNASFNFDASVKQFIQLLSGRSIVLVPEAARWDAALALEFIRAQRIDCIDCTPSQLRSWLEAGLLTSDEHQPRMVLVGGEAIDAALWDQLAQSSHTDFYNVYGPTESTVDATATRIDSQGAGPSIGIPLENRTIYLLDAYEQLVPVGIPGEICIGGAGVARGYLNRPELNSTRFVKDPFDAEPSSRMYKTGDVGRWRHDGTIEYLGRNDHQVKLRGFRIELGEIESQLALHPLVKEAAATVREDVPGDKRLVSYVVLRPPAGAEAVPDVENLRSFLSSALPQYMVPSAFVILERLPLTPNGKVDRSALPAPDSGSYASTQYEPPQSELEELLAGVWEDLLGVQRVGRRDNFFTLGGHSLLIVQMRARLQRLGLSADVRIIYQAATLADLAFKLAEPSTGISIPPKLIPPDCAAITPQMLSLVELEQDHIDTIVEQVSGGARNIEDIYPLTSLQEGMLFHHLLRKGGGDAYVRPMLFELASREKMEQFVRSLQQIIDRHDALRAAILWEKLPTPVQVVHRRAALPVQELIVEAGGDALGELKELMRRDRQRMDLRRAPLMRMYVAAEQRGSQYYALLQTHHLVCDNASTKIMLAELLACLGGRAHLLPESTEYRDHIAQSLAHAKACDATAFFRKKFAGVDEPTAPFGVLDVQSDSSGHESGRVEIERSLAGRIRTTSRRLSVTAATLFHAAWALVVSHTSGREDVVFGTVLLGRLHGSAGAQRSLGMFINTLPLRLRLQGITAQELVEHTQKEIVDLLNHEQASLAVAQRCSDMTGSTPLFSSLLNYLHSSVDRESEFAHVDGVQLLASQGGTNYPVAVSVDDRGAGFVLEVESDPRVAPQRMVEYLHRAIESLVRALETAPRSPALTLEILPSAEHQQIVTGFNLTRAEYPQRKLIHELFEEQVQKTPGAMAASGGGSMLTYEELNTRSNQLARYLRQRQVGPDCLVGIFLERGLDLLVGVLGVLKAGAAYVPLDPAYPQRRLQQMLEDSSPTAVLTQESLRGRLPTAATGVVLSISAREIAQQSPLNLLRREIDSIESDLAYVIYTSGSTGKPKGVAIEHRNAVNLIYWARSEMPSDVFSRTLLSTSFNFDLSIYECFVPLSMGGSVHIVHNALALAEELTDVTLINTVPSAIKAVLDSKSVPPTVQVINLAGEALGRELVERILSSTPVQQVCNLYGPTETTTYSSWIRMHRCDGFRVSIGRPIANTEFYILDKLRQIVPIGVIGEIYIGGAGVTRGYLRQPALTAERFLADPFTSNPGARMYKTGDQGRWLADGTIEYLGRNDHQVKIRGFRIELGEIESQLRQQTGVKEAVVLAREDSAQDKRLVAYVIFEEDSGSVDELRASLKAQLPEYMVPSAFVTLETLPLTPNGKFDRSALPAPELSAYPAQNYEAPRGGDEAALAEIWQELLGVDRIGRHDNFFELGGHSLHGVKLIVKVVERFAVNLSVITVFQHPSIAEMARLIAELQSSAASVEHDELVFEEGAI